MVEILYIDGCPNYEPLETRVRRLIGQSAPEAVLRRSRIDSDADAVAHQFLGSPTVRVDGVDVDPAAAVRRDYSLSCRLYATVDGLGGTPPDEWIAAALLR